MGGGDGPPSLRRWEHRVRHPLFGWSRKGLYFFTTWRNLATDKGPFIFEGWKEGRMQVFRRRQWWAVAAGLGTLEAEGVPLAAAIFFQIRTRMVISWDWFQVDWRNVLFSFCFSSLLLIRPAIFWKHYLPVRNTAHWCQQSWRFNVWRV